MHIYKSVECFPALSDFLVDTESEIQEVVFYDVILHLRDLQCMFLKCFSPQLDSPSWVTHPVLVKDIPNKMESQDY